LSGGGRRPLLFSGIAAESDAQTQAEVALSLETERSLLSLERRERSQPLCRGADMKARYFEKLQKMTRGRAGRRFPMITASARLGLTAVFLAAIVIFSSTASSLASSTDAITRAVLTSGAPSTKQARARAFINAFSSVAIRVKDKQLPSYVSAAATLRPDLADKIVVAALKSRPPEDRPPCDLFDGIVKAAIAAAPDAKRAIVRAALETSPGARKCILAAAEIDENNIAFFRPPGVNGTINPANISTAGGQGNIQSPEQPPTP
jgi:hypothetical protein